MEVLHTLIKDNTSICSQIFKRTRKSFRHQSEGVLSKEFNMQYQRTRRQTLWVKPNYLPLFYHITERTRNY